MPHAQRDYMFAMANRDPKKRPPQLHNFNPFSDPPEKQKRGNLDTSAGIIGLKALIKPSQKNNHAWKKEAKK